MKIFGIGAPSIDEDNYKQRGTFSSVVSDQYLQHAYQVIKDVYGDTVRIKPKNLLKYGFTSNADSGVKTTIMTLPTTIANESYLTSNLITHISSADAGDTQVITIEGHTISGTDKTFVAQSVTLQGQTAVALTTPLARATRAFNAGSTNLTGPVYIAETDTVIAGVPQTATKVHLIIAAGRNQSEKAATAFSSVDYGLITGVYAAINRNSGANVTADIDLEIAEAGKVFRSQLELGLRTSGLSAQFIPLNPYIIVPKNADVRLVGTSNTNDTALFGWFNTFIATIQ